MELMNRVLNKGWRLYLRVRVAATLWWLRKKTGLTRVEAAQKLEVDEVVLGSYEYARVSSPMRIIAKMLRTSHADERAIMYFCCLSFVPPSPMKTDPKCTAQFFTGPLGAAASFAVRSWSF